MSATLTVLLTDAQMDDLACRIAKALEMPAMNRPMSAAQVGKLLGVSGEAIRQRVKAGHIPKLPGMGKRVLISKETVARLQRGEQLKG